MWIKKRATERIHLVWELLTVAVATLAYTGDKIGQNIIGTHVRVYTHTQTSIRTLGKPGSDTCVVSMPISWL